MNTTQTQLELDTFGAYEGEHSDQMAQDEAEVIATIRAENILSYC